MGAAGSACVPENRSILSLPVLAHGCTGLKKGCSLCRPFRAGDDYSKAFKPMFFCQQT
jgi:hypothetical protein